MIERCHRRIYCLVVLGGIWMLLGGSTQTAEAKPQRKGPEVTIARSIQPVNVNGGVFFDQSCARAHAIYTVPAGKLLIIEDASALAVDSATASDPSDPGIVDGVPVRLSLRTNPTGTVEFGSADHLIVSGIGLPIAGGRTMKAYAAPETEVLFLLGGCQNTVNVNTVVNFSGELVDFP